MRSDSATKLALVAIPLIVIVTYRRAFAAYFVEDDFQWLVSAWYFDFANLIDFSRYNHFYRPIVEIYFYVGVQAFSHSAALFHWAGILLHSLNGLVVYGLTRSISRDSRFALFSAVSFVVLPGYVDAVAWVGAIAEPLSTLFYCLTLWVFLIYLNSRRHVWHLAAVGTFALALITHESTATLVVMMLLTDWAFGPRRTLTATRRSLGWLADYAPFLLLLSVYLTIDLGVNRRNYVVAEGYYRLGAHVVHNILDYIVSLYVGKKMLASYLAIGIAVVVFLVTGSRRVRFASLWVLITLLPFAFFTWGNASRYLYLPAIGFSMLLAEAVLAVDRLAAARLPVRWRRVVVGTLFLALVVRFVAFTTKSVDDFVNRTFVYREYIQAFRAAHPRLPAGAPVRVPIPRDARLQQIYLEPLVQWEYADPTIHLQIVPES